MLMVIKAASNFAKHTGTGVYLCTRVCVCVNDLKWLPT